MEDIEKEITEFTAIEPIVKSIETIKNISIEHAYSEEIVSSDKQEKNSIDAASSPNTSSIEPVLEESILNADALPIIESKQDFILEQVAEKVKSRELKSLLEAAKESNLDTNIIHKRESRKSVDPYGTKASSDSHESGGKRTMRSQNADISFKQYKILHKMNKSEINSEGVVAQDNNDIQNQKKEKDSGIIIKTLKRKKDHSIDSPVDGAIGEESKKSRKSFKVEMPNTQIKNGKDSFCWRCHRDGILVQCETCPRAYHSRCLKQPVNNPDRWPCPECLAILHAESTKTRSPAMRDMSLEHLCELLKYAVKRMIGCAGSEPFIHPVDLKTFPDYRNYVVQPMDLTTLEINIRNNLYGSTVAFLADAKWILHNSIIYNSYQSKLTTAAKSITKICKQETAEIETCSECYQNANTKKNSWFVEVCPKPHVLLWAKLKGFPYWPAKAMTTNAAGLVDVRFFGAHDRAWIPVKECFLYSKKDPNTTNKNKRNNIAECIKEVDIHIEKLKEKYGEFCHAPYRTFYDPNAELEQLGFMLPRFKIPQKIKPTISIVRTPKKEKDDEEEDEETQKQKAKIALKSNSRESSVSKDDLVLKNAESIIEDGSEPRIRCPGDISDEMEVLSSSSKASISNEEKASLDKNIKFSTQDFDKFMEGYGTEDDETTSLTLNDEIRKKIVQYESDSGEESISEKHTSDVVESSTETKEYNHLSSSTSSSSPEKSPAAITLKPSEKYTNLTGKIRIIRTKRPIDLNWKRNQSGAHVEPESPLKVQRRNSDMSTTSDSSRISGLSDKISRVEEFSDTLEVSLANTSKDSAVVSFSENVSPEKKGTSELIPPAAEHADRIHLKPVVQICTGDLFNKNKDLKISPQSKAGSIADRLMKKMTGTEGTNEMDKVEAVKKQILENLETSTCSSQVTNDLVSSSNNDTTTTATNNDDDDDDDDDDAAAVLNAADKNQNVSSSTEATDSENNRTAKDATNTTEDATNKESNETTKKKNLLDIISDDESELSDEEDSESEQSSVAEKSSHVKLVNVSDILSGKINGNASLEMIAKSQTSPDLLQVKSEPLSDDDLMEPEPEKDDEKQSQNATNAKKKRPFKVVDNLTRIIDSVASDYNSPLRLSKKELSLRPISKLIQSPKQRARKSFPNSPLVMNHISMITNSVKKIIADKKETFNMHAMLAPSGNIKVATSLQSSTANTSQENNGGMMYIAPQQTPVINNMALLPPNQPITLTQNVGSPILAMVQHHGISTPSLIIQQSSTSANVPQMSAPVVVAVATAAATTSTVSSAQSAHAAPIASVTTSEAADDRGGISEQISKAVGELFCRPPPVLKPRPPGPLTTYFDEGIPSTVGPTTKMVNSISHRLTDYFRGFLSETFRELSNIGSPEAKIRSLELEIESLKYKHNEEMIELRKNISSILKDIQKSITEDKAKIVDETRSACEAERLRCIEETKSKQWCAYCLKEAQFYCCWNTSYCDYPCQQKHWPAHMNTCSQSRNNASSGANNTNSNDKSHMHAASKLTKAINTNNKTVLKSTRMIVKQTSKGLPMYVPVQRSLQAGQQTLTLVESTPGNFEIVGNHGPISLGGKIVPTTTIKVKPGNVITVASSSNSNTSISSSAGTSKTIILSQKPQPQQILPKLIMPDNKT